jgi:hypothetical protein
MASWKPRSSSDYWAVYDAYPAPGPPGTTGSASFHLKAPFETGTYYLRFCLYDDYVYNMLETFLSELSSPGHIKLIVTDAPTTVTVSAKTSAAVVSSPLSIPLIPVGVVGVSVAVVGSVVAVGVRVGS